MKTRVIIWGAGGKMGQVIANLCRNDEEIELVCGIDKFANPKDFSYEIYNNINACNRAADVIIDFSRPEALEDILDFSCLRKIPVVLCTTGYSDNQLSAIDEHAKHVAVFRSFNMSLGINLLCDLVKKAASVLSDKFDIEIIEKHHNQKVDAPSGTAIMLANAAKSVMENCNELVYGRHGTSEKRHSGDIGIHAVRGGSIVGDHDVIFAGHNEVITLSHRAESKEIFANGAIAAAKFLKGKPHGKYSMQDIFN